MVIGRAAHFPHDPAKALLAGQWRGRERVCRRASLIRRVERVLIGHGEHIRARIRRAVAAALLAEDDRIRSSIHDVGDADLAQVIEDPRGALAGGNGAWQGFAQVAKKRGAQVAIVVVLSRPIARLSCRVGWAKVSCDHAAAGVGVLPAGGGDLPPAGIAAVGAASPVR